MQRYRNDDSHEREPLDSSMAYAHGIYPHRSVSPESHAYSQPDTPYHDASPRHPQAPSSLSYGQDHGSYDDSQPPPPPRHGDNTYYTRGRPEREVHDTGYAHAQRLAHSTVTPGADNFSESAAGGVAGIAYGVAERNARNSGMEAMHGSLPPPPSFAQYPNMPRQTYAPNGNGYDYDVERGSQHSGLNPLGMPATAPASRSPSRSPRNQNEPYNDDPYQVYSNTPRNNNSTLGIVNPNEIEDDGDDGLDYSKHSQRNSMLSASNSDRAARAGLGAAAAVGGAAAAGGAVGGILSRNRNSGSGGEGEGHGYDLNTGQEKSSEWMAKQSAKSKRWKWTVIILVFLVIVGAIVGGVVGGLIGGSKNGGKSGGGGGGGQSASDDTKNNGDLNINSQEIKDLLNNPNLHKVFPGIDYTPLNTQYPDCLTNPPSQNNITRDLAVLSQLTNKIRLYGTDCNQTQMLLHSISQLEMTKDIKVWLGVWQDNNDTTNARQLDQMWTILDNYGADPFEGIIVANEVLFRQQFTITSLGSLLSDVRTNLTKKGINLPVATSDLGDDWTQQLADDSDYIMANVHPFFSGTPANEAAGWTYDFWQSRDGPFWKSDKSKNVISETGWPTGGGTDCGSASTCTNGAVAGIDELNTFMNDWVCQALTNGTNYFWFEAFDEPWKVQFNTPGKEWEDKWGLMDVNRKLKPGVKIPDCGGKTVS